MFEVGSGEAGITPRAACDCFGSPGPAQASVSDPDFAVTGGNLDLAQCDCNGEILSWAEFGLHFIKAGVPVTLNLWH